MGIRQSYRSLTPDQRRRFVQALLQVKADGLVDDFADLHTTHFGHGIHRSSHFLPWHRELLLRFETALQAHDATVSLPYWDSTVDTRPSDPLWENTFLGQFDAAWQLGRVLGSDTLPTIAQVRAVQGTGAYDSYWRNLETRIHNPPHRWVNGVMASPGSPGDPVFYLHHCWIDMLWVLWGLEFPDAAFTASGPGVGLNDPLMEWPDRTAADVLDHRALGYSYDVEETTVPALVGLTQTRALSAIRTAGLVGRSVGATAAGTKWVVSQTPVAGAGVQRASTVTIRVSLSRPGT